MKQDKSFNVLINKANIGSLMQDSLNQQNYIPPFDHLLCKISQAGDEPIFEVQSCL